jgi:hypothetical protein
MAKPPGQMINTAHIERTNLDRRLRGAHLTRKAPTAAKPMRRLKTKFALNP